MTSLTISDVSRIFVGKSLDKKKCNEEKKGLPVIVGASSLKSGGIETVRYSEPTEKSIISKFGDVLVSRVGTCGKVAVNNIGDAIITEAVIAVRFMPWLMLPCVGLMHIVHAIENLHIIPEFDEGTIGFQREMSADIIANIEIWPLDTAKNIADVDAMKGIAKGFSKADKPKKEQTPEVLPPVSELMADIKKDIANMSKGYKELEKLLADQDLENSIQILDDIQGELF